MYKTSSADNFIKQILLFSFFVILTFFLFLGQNKSGNYNFRIYMTFYAIGFYALMQIVFEIKNHAFSCNMFHWLFVFFFLFCSPYLQYSTGSFALRYNPSEQQMIRTNFLIIAWEIVYSLFFYYKKSRTNQNTEEQVFDTTSVNTNELHMFLLLFIGISFLIAVYMLAKGGTGIIFSRDDGEGVFVSENSFKTSLITYIARNFVTFSTALAIVYFKSSKNPLPLLLMSVLLFVTCSPFGMPRFQTATVYCGLLIIAFPKLSKRNIFVIGFVFAFMILFPMINVFRYDSFLEYNIAELFKESINSVTDNFTDANFDAYVMLIKVQKYVQENGPTYGRQLMGAILFFVPRSIWSGKPFGSGYTVHIAEGKYGAEANVSCPLPAEGYINFGIFGTLLFAAILGYVICKLDSTFFNTPNSIKGIRNKIVYAFIPTIVFFMLRGDLMSTISFLVAYIAVGKAMTYLTVK